MDILLDLSLFLGTFLSELTKSLTCFTAIVYFPELATVFYPSCHVSVRSHDSEMLCNHCCKIWRCTCAIKAPTTGQPSSIIDTKAHLMAQLTQRLDALIAA